MTRLLVIEDEADLREILSFNLEGEGYGVALAASAEEGLKLLGPEIDLILLDVMLPGMSGYEFARKIRLELHCTQPIIFLTARSTEGDLLEGFSSGGDDYVSKPFSYNELNARIKAVLRRCGEAAPVNEKIRIGHLLIDPEAGLASMDGELIKFSRKEFDLLVLLARSRGSYFSRSRIISELWKDAPYVLDRTIDVHIARIRSKLGKMHDLVRNKTGFGYYIDPAYEDND